jgi:ABC-type uncharacterized transport system ATPase subunit
MKEEAKMPNGQTLQCTDITVRFGSTVALDSASSSFDSGKIHAIVGQNGAGKTTLARVIAGLVLPASGRVHFNGEDLPLGNVIESRGRGIQMVHQSFALPPSFSVAEALDFGGGRRKHSLFTRSRLNAYWQSYLEQLGIEVDVRRRIRDLPVEVRQSIEIARALTTDATVLILDEPTAVLRPEAREQLFERVRVLRDRGVTVLIVLHKVREVLAVADTVTVLRNGRVVLRRDSMEDVTPGALASAIVGTSTSIAGEDLRAAVGTDADDSGRQLAEQVPAATPSQAPALLSLRKGYTKSDQFGVGLTDASVDLLAGELTGLAGVEGNGQLALVRAIAGLTPLTSGRLELCGQDVTGSGVSARRATGLRVIPFDRSHEGLSVSSSLWENLALPSLIGGTGSPLIDATSLKSQARRALDQWGVKYSSVDQAARELSGGNAQKLILAREMDDEARVVIAAQPTRGLDLGAVEVVWTALRRARDGGAAVLLISSDLDELQEVCDRILVVASGSIAYDCRRPFDASLIADALTAKAMS